MPVLVGADFAVDVALVDRLDLGRKDGAAQPNVASRLVHFPLALLFFVGRHELVHPCSRAAQHALNPCPPPSAMPMSAPNSPGIRTPKPTSINLDVCSLGDLRPDVNVLFNNGLEFRWCRVHGGESHGREFIGNVF